jgi:hypothetical protein
MNGADRYVGFDSQMELHLGTQKIAFTIACATLLSGAGLAAPYDVSAIPDAAAARQHALNLCQAKSGSFKTQRASVECGLAAHRLYATTEKLRDMASFNAYATTVRRAAADADAGRISQTDAAHQSAAAGAEYDAKIQKQYSDWQTTQVAAHKGPMFDRASLHAAKTARDKAVVGCGTWTAAKPTAHAICILKAEKAFVTSISLQQMNLFYGYASVIRVDAVDAEDGRRVPGTLESEHQRLWDDFLKALEQAYGARQPI